jgi:phosphoribosyl-AMP cyclohydrolase
MDSPSFLPPGEKPALESGDSFTPKFDADGLIPAIAQDHASGQVLMLAYMNAESLALTIEKGEAVYYSRSRNKLWHKGESSGHVQVVHEMLTDCDQDTILLRVEQRGPGCCHTGHAACFFRRITSPKALVTISSKAFDPASVY